MDYWKLVNQDLSDIFEFGRVNGVGGTRKPYDGANDKKLLAAKGIRLDEAIQKFYDSVGCVDMKWKTSTSYAPEKFEYSKDMIAALPEPQKSDVKSITRRWPYVGGIIYINPLEQLIAAYNAPDTSWGDSHWLEGLYDDQPDFWNSFLVFEKAAPECMILLKVQGGEVKDELFYHFKGKKEPASLNMGIERYLTIAYKVRAFTGWQHALLKPPFDTGLSLQRMEHYLPRIFPELKFDFSDFQ